MNYERPEIALIGSAGKEIQFGHKASMPTADGVNGEGQITYTSNAYEADE